jgi:hypothetical protein
MPDRAEPTFKENIRSIHRIVLGQERPRSEKMRRGLSPGLLLMAVAALVITILAAVKSMK